MNNIENENYSNLSNFVYNVHVATHNGNVRDNNEDNYSINGISKPVDIKVCSFERILTNDCLLAEVCDGMGGEANGELASYIATKNSNDLFRALKNAPLEQINDFVDSYVDHSNKQICDMLANDKSNRGGSTFALSFIKKNVLYSFSLGDSRIYLYRDGELNQISQDHTLAMRKYLANIYTKEEAEQSSDSHKLTLFLGVDINNNGLVAEKYPPIEIKNGDKILLCSDGLYDMCNKEEIIRIISSNHQNVAKELVDMALGNGGIDNITCVVFKCEQNGTPINSQTPKTSVVCREARKCNSKKIKGINNNNNTKLQKTYHKVIRLFRTICK